MTGCLCLLLLRLSFEKTLISFVGAFGSCMMLSAHTSIAAVLLYGGIRVLVYTDNDLSLVLNTVSLACVLGLA